MAISFKFLEDNCGDRDIVEARKFDLGCFVMSKAHIFHRGQTHFTDGIATARYPFEEVRDNDRIY